MSYVLILKRVFDGFCKFYIENTTNVKISLSYNYFVRNTKKKWYISATSSRMTWCRYMSATKSHVWLSDFHVAVLHKHRGNICRTHPIPPAHTNTHTHIWESCTHILSSRDFFIISYKRFALRRLRVFELVGGHLHQLKNFGKNDTYKYI